MTVPRSAVSTLAFVTTLPTDPTQELKSNRVLGKRKKNPMKALEQCTKAMHKAIQDGKMPNEEVRAQAAAACAAICAEYSATKDLYDHLRNSSKKRRSKESPSKKRRKTRSASPPPTTSKALRKKYRRSRSCQ